jgi:hypothetical protein
MFSLPIPETVEAAQRYKYNNLNLPSEIKNLKIYCKKQSDYCHLDPDIRQDLWKKLPEGWYPAFGGDASPQSMEYPHEYDFDVPSPSAGAGGAHHTFRLYEAACRFS